MTTYWYRLEDRRVSVDEYTSRTEVTLCKLIVVKETPKGVKLVGIGHGRKNPRQVLHDSKKKWACATVAEAVESFKKRKERQARIYRARAAEADEAHDIAATGAYRTLPDWMLPKEGEFSDV